MAHRRNEIGQFVEVEMINVECPECGLIHEMYPSDYNRGRRFCSRKCSYAWLSKNRRGKAHHRYTRKEFVCEECGKTFEDIPSKNRMYCSNICANLNNAPHYSGSKNPKWKGGITPVIRAIRTSMEYSIWRTEIFERDEYTCQVCGTKTQYLHAHHIVALSDDITMALDIDNGITLCVDCHQKEHPELRLTLRRNPQNVCRL